MSASLPEAVRDEQLRILGPELGSLYCALLNEVIWLHAKWLEYRKLYAHSPERIDLLNATAGFFFGVMHDVLWEDVLLHLARLTDPVQSTGKSNLTLNALASVIPDQMLRSHIQALVEQAVAFSGFARDWRNRHLAHRDLKLALGIGVTPLPNISREQVQKSLNAIGIVLNRISTHYFESETAFGSFVAQSDAEALTYYLKLAIDTEEEQERQLRT